MTNSTASQADTQPATRLAAALALAERNFRVFPLIPGKKLPLFENPYGQSTTDPAKLAEWFAEDPLFEEPNIGVAAGESRLVILDCDTKNGKDGLTTLKTVAGAAFAECEATLTVRTPSGGLHYYFSGEPVPSSVEKLGRGLDVRSRGGLAVGPGSATAAGEYTIINKAAVRPLPAVLLQAIHNAASDAAAVTLAEPIELDTPSAISQAETYLADAPPSIEGQGGNDNAYRVICGLRDLGISEERAADLLADWNGRCSPPWAAGELERIVANAFQYGQNAPGTYAAAADFDVVSEIDVSAIGRPPANIDGADMLTRSAMNLGALAGRPVPQQAWHVTGLVPAETVTLLGGDGGTGKSLLAMQLAVATATGRKWIGRQVVAGHVVYLAAEDSPDVLHSRVANIVSTEGVTLRDLAGLTLISLFGKDAVLAASGQGDIIKPTRLASALVSLIRQRRPSLVVLDTLADVFAGNENIRTQVRQFVTMLSGLAAMHGAAVLLLAHPSLSGLNSGSGLSGSTAWNNSVRSRLYLARLADSDKSERDPDIRVLTVMKANYSRTGEAIRLRWSNGVFGPEGTAPIGEGAEQFRLEAETLFLELLDRYTGEGRRVSASPSANYAPSLFARDERSKFTTKLDLRAAMDRLFAKGAIAVVTEGPASKQRTRIARVDVLPAEDDLK